ncbi:MAG: NADH-quinone oxidoreductase subunit K [Candidatus Methanomethylicia archaeon]|uniref:NADH-quinone oxidoreductase subunit K n=1 Tax=Candidatus Methanomethylicus mesodigestus TaxID=1867258 RepID=A0A7C3ESU4_9CREN|nr:NADH-quinone oxidoreductase subunit K [Candidatus Methanomethylicia archaeon]
MIYSATAMALILIGIYCIATKHNMIKIIIGIEIICAGVNLNFISLAWDGQQSDPLASSVVLVSIAIGAAIAAFALAFVMNAFKQTGSSDARKLRRLRW